MLQQPLKKWQRRQKERMANPEHLEQLKRGRLAWNQWRKEHPEIRPDLSEIKAWDLELIDFELEAYDLRGVLLREADFVGMTFPGTQLQGADLSETYLHSARFWKADLTGACLRNAVIQFTVFAGVQLKDADLTGTDAVIAEFDGQSDEPPSGLSGPFHAADLRGATLTHANFEGARLSGVNLEKALLLGTALNFAYLDGACLRQANLRNAQLVGVNLQRADLRGANLQRAIFNLHNPNWNGFQDVGNPQHVFSDANLKGADLRGADLRGTDLVGVDLSEAFLEGAIF